MPSTELNCLPTIIGSMPQTDPAKACALIRRFLRDIPAWPQLPKRDFRENMYAQYSQGFPGVVIDGDRIYVDTSKDFQKPLEELYTAYLENNVDKFPISPEYAAGFYAFLGMPNLAPPLVKGQVTGPLSWGLTVTDETKRAILFHEVLGDAVPKLLKLKAAWQEKELKKISQNTIIFVDEPYMASYGSVVASGPFSKPEKIAEMIDEVFSGISGLKGLHCCGNTDWSVLLKTRLDILSFDAYNYAESLSLYPAEIKKFLGRGGAIAWGIVPNNRDSLAKESVASLKDRLEAAMAPFTRSGVRFKDLVKQSLLTPSCTLTPLSEDGAEQALRLLTELSDEMRRRYL
jgi:methionine synthase II (cobalamin-independent)